MALQVWLPLTKDLRNQGLSNVTVTNNGATFNSAGKLGGCYSFGTGNSYITVDSTPLKTFTEFSFACWVKIISWNTSYSTVFAAKNGTSVGWTNLIFALLRNSSNSTLCFNIADGSSHTTTNCQTGTLSLNTWYHIVCTYKSGEIRLYQDGDVVSTFKTTVTPNFNSIVNLWIGKSNANSYQSNNLLNDVRIYDHCLSPMEVKKLSQGLVLHYPLSDKFLEGTTNLVTSITSGGQTTWANNILTTSGTNADTYFTLNLSENIVNGTQYTISCDAEDIPQGTCWTFPLGQQGNTALSFQIYNGHNEYTFTANNISWGTKRCFMDDGGSPNSARATGAKCKIYNFQIEKKDHATGFAGYGGTRNANTVYDCSGFVNNGTVSGSLTISNDTPKYQVSTHIGAASQKIHIPDLITSGFANTYSFAWWGKNTAFGNKMFWGFSNGIRLNGMYYGTLWNTGDGSNNPLYKIGTTTQVSAPSANTWHHYVMTGNGTKCYVYLDGELWAEAKTYKAISGTSIYINGWDSGTSYSYDNMDMSDFRIYATALSASDVKSLYQNCATIDPDGTIHGQIRN